MFQWSIISLKCISNLKVTLALVTYVRNEERLCKKIESFSNDNGNELSLADVTLLSFYYFAIIPIRSTCTLWVKYVGTKFMETEIK